MARRRKNSIEGHKINGDEWCSVDDQLKHHVVKRFTRLYFINSLSADFFSCRGRFPGLLFAVRSALEETVIDVKICMTLFSMVPLKVPGIDGYHAKFYQVHWDMVSLSICTLVRSVLEGQPLDPSLNCTLLVLIPKVIGLKHIT